MKKVYLDVLAKNPRYIRMLFVMAIIVVLIVSAIVIYSFKSLEQDKLKLSAAEYRLVENRTKSTVYANALFGLATISLMVFIAWAKRQVKVTITPEGIEFFSVFRKTYIAWEDVKDYRVLNRNTAFEKCRIRSKDLERVIEFTPYFLDESLKWEVNDKGVFDEHGQPLLGQVKKGKLYKEVARRAKGN